MDKPKVNSNKQAFKVHGAIKAIKELARSKLSDMEYYYKLAENKKISDPEISKIYSDKGDVMSDQLDLIKHVSEIFGVKFKYYERDDGKIAMTEPVFEGRC